MSIYKLSGDFSATADSAFSLDVQFDGVITAIDWDANGDFDADLEAAEFEVSFLSSNTFAKNDARGSVSSISIRPNFTTSGMANSAVQKTVSGVRIAVSAGERIHLHGKLTGTNDCTATCYLHVEDSADPRLRRRR